MEKRDQKKLSRSCRKIYRNVIFNYLLYLPHNLNHRLMLYETLSDLEELPISKYKKIEYTAVKYENPKVLMSQIREIEKDIMKGLDEIEKMI